jgi:hypothetical protein
VAKTIKPTATFSTELAPARVNAQNVKLEMYNTKQKKWVAVTSTPSYASKIITVTLTKSLGSQQQYRITLTTGIKDTNGKALEQQYVWSFTAKK